MKPYGLPRHKDVEAPDIGDIKVYGLKTSAGGKDYFRGRKRQKAATRRRWKRKARQVNKKLCQE